MSQGCYGTYSNTRIGCPICGSLRTRAILELAFPKKKYLPDRISLSICSRCDFAFTIPANQDLYNSYYAETANDLIHQECAELGLIQETDLAGSQVRRLSRVLQGREGLLVLDYGCGSGRLLHSLTSTYPGHSYYGFDLHPDEQLLQRNGPKEKNGNNPIVLSSEALNEVPKFDLLILSHVLEHIVDLSEFERALDFLKPGGLLYVEVPDASEYRNFERREHLYYIDRLHVNHFSSRALEILAERCDLMDTVLSKCVFNYKDGKNYPAIYMLARKRTSALEASLEQYISNERDHRRALSINEKEGVIVYGFGDNFLRSRSNGGPLADVKILTVVDKRSVELRHSEYRAMFTFSTLEEAVVLHPNAPIVITVSWGTDAIIEQVRRLTNANILTV